ncbi:MAG: CoA pyrophosphatase [candidate division NC10 bacterium]|nr:CoA pyrophosphatase [candidate division NC10 bacterium]
MLDLAALRRVLAAQRTAPAEGSGLRQAAVLVPLTGGADGPRVLFVRRSAALPLHGGQIAFPGGTWRQADASLLATALREAQEEIGLRPTDVEVLGTLSDTVTATSRFCIRPFVGWIPPGTALAPDRAEVEAILPVPLALLREPANFREERWERDGQSVPVYFYQAGSEVIWGATARILRELLAAVVAPAPGLPG